MTTPRISPSLRPYQIDALERVRGAIRGGSRNVLLVAPTGSGKTTIAAEMIKSAVEKGNRVLFLAHRKELLNQCHGRLAEFGLASSIIRADDPRLDPEQHIQIASVPTLVRRLGKFAPDAFKLVIVDEAHHVRAESYAKILDHFSGAGAVVGLTATPIRKDGRGLGEAFDALVQASTISELVTMGYLVPTRMFSAPALDLRGVKRTHGDYDVAGLGAVMNTSGLVGSILREWTNRCRDRRTVVFASTVAHSETIVQEFRAAGVTAEHLDATTPGEERDAILARVHAGTTQVVSNCMILTEGWDSPEISACVLARPTKSLALYLQMAGRVLRPAPGKRDCILLDHANCFRDHGTVGAPRNWTLTGDRKTDNKETERQTDKVCPECSAVILVALRVCPECGFAFGWQPGPSLKHVELREVTNEGQREVFMEIVERVRRSRRMDGSPFKETAALVKYRDLFGVWPEWTWQKEAGLR